MNRFEAFGTWLLAERKARGWTRAELAQFIGCDASLIVRWESGEYVPNLPRFVLLMRVLSADANRVLRMIPTSRDDAAAA